MNSEVFYGPVPTGKIAKTAKKYYNSSGQFVKNEAGYFMVLPFCSSLFLFL